MCYKIAIAIGAAVAMPVAYPLDSHIDPKIINLVKPVFDPNPAQFGPQTMLDIKAADPFGWARGRYPDPRITDGMINTFVGAESYCEDIAEKTRKLSLRPEKNPALLRLKPEIARGALLTRIDTAINDLQRYVEDPDVAEFSGKLSHYKDKVPQVCADFEKTVATIRNEQAEAPARMADWRRKVHPFIPYTLKTGRR